MSAYLYNSWAAEPDAPSRIAMLRLHIGEVSALIDPNVAKDGHSRQTDPIVQYHATLLGHLVTLEARPDAMGGSTIARVRLGRP